MKTISQPNAEKHNERGQQLSISEIPWMYNFLHITALHSAGLCTIHPAYIHVTASNIYKIGAHSNRHCFIATLSVLKAESTFKISKSRQL